MLKMLTLFLQACLFFIAIPKTYCNVVTVQQNQFDQASEQCNSTCELIGWAGYANCRYRNLIEVPQECWQAGLLDLRNNNIKKIGANVFQSFQNVYLIDLRENNITIVDAHAFNQAERMEVLNLQDNKIRVLVKETFDGASNLIRLNLQGNKIHTIDFELFKGLSTLESIRLDKNRLNDLSPELLRGLRNLNHFRMSRNKLTVVRNDTFKDLEYLLEIYLNDNYIESIEPTAFKGLVRLRILQIAHNQISVIGYRAFSDLRYMFQLDLYSNRIETVYNFSSELQKINDLYLGENPLICDCRLSPLYLWYTKHAVNNAKANATCAGPEDVRGRTVDDIKPIRLEDTRHIETSDRSPNFDRNKYVPWGQDIYLFWQRSTLTNLIMICISLGTVGILVSLYVMSNIRNKKEKIVKETQIENHYETPIDLGRLGE